MSCLINRIYIDEKKLFHVIFTSSNILPNNEQTQELMAVRILNNLLILFYNIFKIIL